MLNGSFYLLPVENRCFGLNICTSVGTWERSEGELKAEGIRELGRCL
jgi:hypothetical protein